MDWHTFIETALGRERAAGRMTRQEGEELQRRLALLAFNMTLAGQAGAAPRDVIAFWITHLSTKRHEKLPTGPSSKHQRAARWWALGVAAGLLRAEEGGRAFADSGLQAHYSLRFCLTHRLDARLLRLLAREQCKQLARQWAEQEPLLVEQVLEFLRASPEARTRARAALVLGQSGAANAVEPLIAAFADPSARVRISVAQALGTIGEPRGIVALLARLEQEKQDICTQMIAALGRAGSAAVPVLTRLLYHRNFVVARASIWGLGNTRSQEAALLLLELLRDYRPLFSGAGDEAVRALGRLGEVAVEPLIEALEDESSFVRRAAAAALGAIRDPRAAAPLLALLRKEAGLSQPNVPGWRHGIRQYWGIGNALVELDNAPNVELLIAALQDEYAAVRAYAAWALGDTGDQQAIAPLLPLLSDPDSDAQYYASIAVRKLRALAD